jgi:hypothetical protein
MRARKRRSDADSAAARARVHASPTRLLKVII